MSETDSWLAAFLAVPNTHPFVFAKEIGLPQCSESVYEASRRFRAARVPGVGFDRETHAFFAVALFQHVKVFADLGEHPFLAIGNHEIDLCHVVQKEPFKTLVQRFDVLEIECGHGNGTGKLSFQKCLLHDIDGIDLVQDEKRRKFSGVDTPEDFSRDLNVRAQRWIRCIHHMK